MTLFFVNIITFVRAIDTVCGSALRRPWEIMRNGRIAAKLSWTIHVDSLVANQERQMFGQLLLKLREVGTGSQMA